MQEPFESLPKTLHSALEALEKGDLSLACQLFFELDPHFPFFENNPLANCFSKYLDAHLFSGSFNEWAAISQELIEKLEADAAWAIYHEALGEAIKDIHTQAIAIQSYLQKGEISAIQPDLKQRIDLVCHHLGVTPGAILDLRLPQHRLFTHKTASSNQPLSFIHLVGLYQGLKPSAQDLFCTDPQSLFLVLDHFPKESWNTLRVICANSPTLPKLEKERLPQTSIKGPLSSFIDQLHLEIPGTEAFQLAHESLVKWLENESRGFLFKRYQSRGRLSLLYRFQLEDWYQKLSRRNLLLENDPFEKELQALMAERPLYPRQPATKRLPRIVHITAQLIDKTHAPTKLLMKLLNYVNFDKFDVALFVTESLIQRNPSYPWTLRNSESSLTCGTQAIQSLLHQKIAYYVDQPSAEDSFEVTLERVCERLAKIDADVLVFHGPEPLHHAIAASIQGPIKVLFEHGTLPVAPGFDHAICCLEDTEEVSGQKMQAIGCNIHTLPYFSDARWHWQHNYPVKQDLGLDDENMIATTISNHLWTRLTPLFCSTVSEILKRCPKLYYLPIGLVQSPWHEKQMLERFDLSVRSRIRFLGASDTPSQLARPMDFYFNEFPFGSCLGILDAMANGLCVISMYDPKGPPQARYGGLFAGLRAAITSCDPKDYIERACLLYHEPLAYFKASQHSFQEFEWRSNILAYVDKFEAIIASLLENKKSQI